MRFLRYLSIVPALILLAFIFGFSAQTGESSGSFSYEISCEVVRITNSVLSLDLLEDEVLSNATSIHLLIRKLAHVSEYFLLTLLIYFPIHVLLPIQKNTVFKKLLFSSLLTVIFAALDEFHQTFVDGRSGNPIDVMIDSIGIVIAVLLLFIIHVIHQNKMKHRRVL